MSATCRDYWCLRWTGSWCSCCYSVSQEKSCSASRSPKIPALVWLSYSVQLQKVKPYLYRSTNRKKNGNEENIKCLTWKWRKLDAVDGVLCYASPSRQWILAWAPRQDLCVSIAEGKQNMLLLKSWSLNFSAEAWFVLPRNRYRNPLPKTSIDKKRIESTGTESAK